MDFIFLGVFPNNWVQKDRKGSSDEEEDDITGKSADMLEKEIDSIINNEKSIDKTKEKEGKIKLNI